MSAGLDWIGLDLSQNITPPRASCGANNTAQCTVVFGQINFGKEAFLSYNGVSRRNVGKLWVEFRDWGLIIFKNLTSWAQF